MERQQAAPKSKPQERRTPPITSETDDPLYAAPVTSQNMTPGNILNLQRTVGNQAVQGMLDIPGKAKTKTQSFAWLGNRGTIQRCGDCGPGEEDTHHKPKVRGQECNHEEEEMHKPKLIQRDPTDTPTPTTTPSTTTTAPTTAPTTTPLDPRGMQPKQ